MSVRIGAGKPPRSRRTWPRIFAGGLVLWVATAYVTLVTGNVALLPTLVLLGSFLMPVSFVAWAFERWHDEHVTTELVVNAFVVGGLLGVLGSSVLEAYLLHPSPLLFLGVGLIEEAAKLGGLVLLTRRLAYRHARDGFVLGAAVGFGFAAFETAGYAFAALLTLHGLSLQALVETELLRGVLAPFGHGLWTAILGGVLFREARNGRPRYTWPLLATYLWVSVLHALWDYVPGVATVLTYLLTGSAWQLELMTHGYVLQPTRAQAHLHVVLSSGGLAVVALLGIATLIALWRAAGRQDRRRS
jgi:protease PrsW